MLKPEINKKHSWKFRRLEKSDRHTSSIFECVKCGVEKQNIYGKYPPKLETIIYFDKDNPKGTTKYIPCVVVTNQLNFLNE